jgi:serine/threonine-protein kinase HipA
MSDFEVHIALNGRTRQVGLARSNRVRGKETILFEYDDAWLNSDRKSLFVGGRWEAGRSGESA